MPTIGLEYRYPFISVQSWGTQTIEPIAQVIVRPDEPNIGRFPNAKLVDWKGTASAHPEAFYKDGVHLRPSAVGMYVDLLPEETRERLLAEAAGPGGELPA